ncbi:MAG TPA: PASTA domain-containing protein, partial [Solirubrobacteraceae bacterium]|nr:PASTA domain-containing protein [Solirubrobacteraceae bacterium]
TLSGLTAGHSAPVDTVVTPRAGTHTNTATVGQPTAVTDPVTTNNSAKAKFTVGKLVVPKCVVATSLAKLPLGTAKQLLTALNRKVGKVTKSSSRTVAKGDVIKTTPGHGSFAAGKAIAIVESSGPPSKKRKQRAAETRRQVA